MKISHSFIILALSASVIVACKKSNDPTPSSSNNSSSNNNNNTSNGPAVVTTFAGSGPGHNNGTGAAASFFSPGAVACDASGNIYVADSNNDLIRKITPAGVVSTMAGTVNVSGKTNATGTSASFSNPAGIAIDASGNVYVGDAGNNLVRKITTGDVVSTLAGSSLNGNANGTGTAASFRAPSGVAVDASGNVYVADYNNSMIRKITAGGVVTTIAGTSGNYGSTNGTGTAASFNGPAAVAVDASGNIYVADSQNNLIRKITSGGVVTTFAGSGNIGTSDGTGTAASFNTPSGIVIDASGNLYIADTGNSLIRKITSAGVVTTIAGSVGNPGFTNGTGTAATFTNPAGITIDASGNLYIADSGNNVIRKITF